MWTSVASNLDLVLNLEWKLSQPERATQLGIYSFQFKSELAYTVEYVCFSCHGNRRRAQFEFRVSSETWALGKPYASIYPSMRKQMNEFRKELSCQGAGDETLSQPANERS